MKKKRAKKKKKAPSLLHSLSQKEKLPLTPRRDDDGDNQAVNTEHTGHDDGHDRLHNELGTHHSHRGDADAGLGRAVGGSEAFVFSYGFVVVIFFQRERERDWWRGRCEWGPRILGFRPCWSGLRERRERKKEERGRDRRRSCSACFWSGRFPRERRRRCKCTLCFSPPSLASTLCHMPRLLLA